MRASWICCAFLMFAACDPGSNPDPSSTCSGTCDRQQRFTVPAGTGSGYLAIDITQVSSGRARLRMFTAGSASPFAVVTAGFEGADLHAYAAVVPGQEYVFDISEDLPLDDGPLDSFDFSATYQPVPDAYEPNDEPEAASLVTSDAVTAYFAAGHRTHFIEREAFDDWYAVDVTGGRLNLVLDDVPANVQPMLGVYRSGELLNSVADDTGQYGRPLGLDVAVTPGRYLVHVGKAGDANAAFGGEPTLPDNFFQPYTLRITR